MNNNRPILLTDCDGVLLNWFSRMKEFQTDIGVCTQHLPALLTNQHGTLGLTDIFNVSCPFLAHRLMVDYNASDYMLDLAIQEPEAEKILRELSADIDIVVVTCLGEDAEIMGRRKSNLKDRYGDIFSDVIGLNPGTSKFKCLEQLSEGREVLAWVDDERSQVSSGVSLGLNCHHYTRGSIVSQKTPNGAKSTESWQDIANDVLASLECDLEP